MGAVMTERTCKRCEETKDLEDFHRNAARSDGLDTTCKACKAEAYQLRKNATKGKTPPRQKRTPKPAASPPRTTSVLIMRPGFGFQAAVEDDVLHIRQYDVEGNVTDDVALSQTEARVLFAQFADWVQ